MFYIIGSKQKVSTIEEINEWSIINTINFLEDLNYVEGIFERTTLEKEIYTQFKYVQVVDSSGNVLYYWFRHNWVPKDSWFRLHECYEELKPYTKVRDSLVNSSFKEMLERIS